MKIPQNENSCNICAIEDVISALIDCFLHMEESEGGVPSLNNYLSLEMCHYKEERAVNVPVSQQICYSSASWDFVILLLIL